MTGLNEGFPVIGEIPKCSYTLVCKWPDLPPGKSLATVIISLKEK